MVSQLKPIALLIIIPLVVLKKLENQITGNRYAQG